MATVDKTFSGGGTFSDQANSADILFSAGGTDYKFTSSVSNMANAGEVGLQNSGDTWETWGVPAGATVTNVELVTYKRVITNSSSRVTSSLIEVDIVNSSASASVVSAVILSNASRTSGTTTGASGSGQKSVLSGSQASNTSIRLQFFNQLSSNASAVTWSYALDDLVIRITYTPAQVELSGTISAGSSVAGTLDVSALMSGTISSGVSMSATLSVNVNLSGTVSSDISLAGSVTVIENTLLSGESTGGIGLAGSLTAIVNLSGTISSEVSLTGVLTGAYTWMGGTIEGAVSLSGSLIAIRNMSGSISGSVSLIGTLTVIDVTVYLAGTISSGISLSGDVTGGVINVDINRELHGRRYLSPSTRKSIKNI